MIGVGNMRKMFYVTTFIIILLVSFLGITYSYEYTGNESLKFELIGPEILYVDVNSDYVEYGIKVLYNGLDISDKVIIDDSLIDTTKLGNYRVKYSIDISDNLEHVYREVRVIDKSSPVISLKGDDKLYILLGGNYIESGYTVNDNYDTDLLDKVDVIGSVDTSKEGEYLLKYRVVDSSGNFNEATRKVIVRKPDITVVDQKENLLRATKFDEKKYLNTIIENKFTDNGIYYEGYVNKVSDIYKIKLKNRDNSLEYLYNMTVIRDNYYSGNLDLTTLVNGKYDVYIVSSQEEKLLNKLDVLSRIVRAKIGNKLITLLYDNDMISIVVEDFTYKYDIVIDPGHGGSDNGASNGIMKEKNLNLKISNYEKCRYESMGLRVYMTRYNDTYGEMLGDNGLNNLSRRALTMGYYGAVSRLVYSNHHNSSVRTGDSGFEILVGNELSLDELVIERSLYNKFKKFYGINDSGMRIYSRNYDNGYSYNKINGEVYTDRNYYAVIRIPRELFNVKTVIFEPIYMSNSNDYNWYVSSDNWIDIAEIKIKEYVNYLGGNYIKDNSECLK